MSVAVKRATVYLDSSLHRVLRLKSAETSRSVSELIGEAVTWALQEDLDDLKIFKKRAHEPTISFESALKELKRNGKI
ncbi:MAG: CopG family transcriptional regulator [Kiritimatiellae bacterium]|nr:CopG family transcriptional regulator [Kiritimatiellia bacterium]MDD5521627.1 CopG family transcriptional regulator [Kiritimatiellia bacterium]